MRKKYFSVLTILFVASLSACVSKDKQNQAELLPAAITPARSPAEATDEPMRIIFVGPKASSILRMQQLSQRTCLVQGTRGSEDETLNVHKQKGVGITYGYDNDLNEYASDKYGWYFDSNGNSMAATSLASVVNLAGEWQLFGSHGNDRGKPTECAVIFTVLFDDPTKVSHALSYLEKSGVLLAYVGPVQIHYAGTPQMRSALLKMLSGSNLNGVTNLSLIPLQ